MYNIVATAQLQFPKLALAMTSNQPHSHPLPKLFLRNTCISFIFMKWYLTINPAYFLSAFPKLHSIWKFDRWATIRGNPIYFTFRVYKNLPKYLTW